MTVSTLAHTLAEQLDTSKVPFETLHETYHPVLVLVRELIGVIPNCDQLLEVWPAGFRTYNLVVPNFLNLPLSLLGMGAPKDLVGLALYSSSMAAQCPYCSAHTCSFALRRGAGREALFGQKTAHEQAVTDVAEALSRVPCDLSAEQINALEAHSSPADVEWLLLGVAMMGFLNKFMDAVGVELEPEALADVGAPLLAAGWRPGKHVDPGASMPASAATVAVDNLGTYLRVVSQAPAAIKLERQWTVGVPGQWPQVGEFLQQRTGHDFPLLRHLSHKRAVRAIATVLKENLDPTQSVIGLRTKVLSGLVFATVVGNDVLAREARKFARHADSQLSEQTMMSIVAFAGQGPDDASASEAHITLACAPELSAQDAAALVLARAASTSPADVTPDILTHISPLLPADGVIELMVWLSVQQMLHRLERFYAVRAD